MSPHVSNCKDIRPNCTDMGKHKRSGFMEHVYIRGVPIIGSATISATDMAFFTNIGIGTEQ